MSPSEFTFKLTIPNDPDGVTVIGAMAAHAVDYAKIDAPRGAAFVARVRDTAEQAMKAHAGSPCLAVFAAADGQLTVTLGSLSISEPLPA
jgi:hypothetical protein